MSQKKILPKKDSPKKRFSQKKDSPKKKKRAVPKNSTKTERSLFSVDYDHHKYYNSIEPKITMPKLKRCSKNLEKKGEGEWTGRKRSK